MSKIIFKYSLKFLFDFLNFCLSLLCNFIIFQSFVEDNCCLEHESESQKTKYPPVRLDSKSVIEVAAENNKNLIWLQDLCALRPAEIKKPDQVAFLLGTENPVMYCTVPKAGSSTLLADMLEIEMGIKTGPKIDDIIIHDMAQRYMQYVNYSSYTNRKPSWYYNFMFVRHPFERLVSAYKDKAEKRYTNKKAPIWYSNIWNTVIKKYRNSDNVTGDITFLEFVRYLMDTPPESYDSHWQTVISRCHPCSINYHFIGRMKTFQRDREFLMTQIGAEKVLKYNDNKPRWLNRKNVEHETEQNHGHFKKYYSQIHKEHVWRLYEIYHDDFKFFNYSIRPFIDFAKE